MVASEPNTLTTACPGYPNTPEKHDLDLKSHMMMLLEDYKKDINKSLKEIQENMNKVEVLTGKQKNNLKKFKRLFCLLIHILLNFLKRFIYVLHGIL